MKKKLFKCCGLVSVLVVLLCSSFHSLVDCPTNDLKKTSSKRAISNQTELWTNVDEIDDGGVYFIRNAGNDSLVWDIPNSNYSDGTAPILYSSNGWGNQRFVVHEQTEYDDKMYYTITPLNSPSSSLRLENNNENGTLKLGKDSNTSLEGFLSNKFIIEKSNYGYTISSGVSTFGKYIIPKDGNLSSNNTLVQKTVSNAKTNKNYQWLFCKTDTLGNDLKNKIYINGTNTQYFNLTPPSTGEFIIETEKYGSTTVDTYLELCNQNNYVLASSDDISTFSRYSRITYNFSNLNDLKVRVRGYNSSAVGYVYLTLRPNNPLYFAGVYDFDKNNNDRLSSLNNVKPYFPDYYIEVQGNRGKSAILEEAPNGKKKINCEYFVFSGHGYSNAAGVEFYNATSPEGLMYSDIPNMSGTKIAIWMSCHGARNYFKSGTSGEKTSMAYETVKNGADYSLGYVGTIYDTTQRSFPENFFESLNNGTSIPEAVNQATQWVKNENWWWWTFFGQFADDFNNPVLYKNGDSLKLDCGDGNYDDDKKKSNVAKIFDSLKSNTLYVDNTSQNQNFAIELSSITSRKSNNNLYDPQYVFKTNYCGDEIEMGFDCNPETGIVTYYNLTYNTIITSVEFETMMGNPSQSVLSSVNQ